MRLPQLTCTLGNRYDTKFLLGGQVKVRGFDIEYFDPGPRPWPKFRDMVTDISYDIGEQAFSHYLIAKDQGKPLIGIPVFPSRFFPHVGFAVHRNSGINSPGDLVGKKIGVSGFGFNPAAWMRGILQDQYDVSVEEVIWVEDAEDPFLSGLNYPRSSRFTIQKGEDLPRMLEEGRIDGIVYPAAGVPLTPATKKLFGDPHREAEQYYSRTFVFPINTLITLKEDVVRRHPELTPALMHAFREAKLSYQRDILDHKELSHSGLEFGKLQSMGIFPDQHGLESNRKSISMMIHYCYAQGLIRKLYSPEELFVC